MILDYKFKKYYILIIYNKVCNCYKYKYTKLKWKIMKFKNQ